MRRVAFMIVVIGAATGAAACRIGEHIAAAPIDSAPDGPPIDAVPIDGPPVFHGLHAAIGQVPVFTGSCHALAGTSMMNSRFTPPVQELDVDAGWEFETTADQYDDPSYHFDPNWPTAQWGAFSVRFRGTIDLDAGPHCFSIDIGATGTDIISGKNACGQLYLGPGDAALAETGFDAASADAYHACATTTAGKTELDIVFWYFNILETAKLVVRTCDGAACTPDQPLDLMRLEPL